MKKENGKFIKIMLVLIFIVTLAIFIKLIINPHYESGWTTETIKLRTHNVYGDWYDIEKRYDVVDYICTPNIIVSDYRNTNEGMYFKSKTTDGVCVIIKEKQILRLI